MADAAYRLAPSIRLTARSAELALDHRHCNRTLAAKNLTACEGHKMPLRVRKDRIRARIRDRDRQNTILDTDRRRHPAEPVELPQSVVDCLPRDRRGILTCPELRA